MTRGRRDAEEWAARFNARVPAGKDLRYAAYERKPGKWSVAATHPEWDAEYHPSRRERLAPVVAGIATLAFWCAVLGGGGYLLANANWSSGSTAAGCDATMRARA